MTQPPAPPRGAPVAAFAGVLDGRSLWLAIDARPGSLALRDAASGDVIALAGEHSDDQPAFRSTRLDLSELPAVTDAAYDVVLVPSSGRSPKPVWTMPLPRAVAPVVDGARWELRRSDEGTLRLVHAAVSDAAELTGIATVGDGIRLTIDPGGDLALLGEDDEIVATFSDGVLTADSLGSPQLARVTAGGLPVRRRGNDIVDPGRAVPLPELYAVEPGFEDRVRLRLRWSGDGLLMARILDPEAPE
jgi:hypothetical protein